MPVFQIKNFLLAASIVCKLGYKLNDIKKLSLDVPCIPGRMELVGIKKNNAKIFIDFAHTPDALANVLKEAKAMCKSKLHVVFGCGGDRDREKRSKMLRSAIENSSKVIFTSDNLRNETFEQIFNDAKEGNKLETVIAIESRKEAILQGSQMIGENDCLVILGKGHEQFQEKGGSYIKYNDFEVIDEIYS